MREPEAGAVAQGVGGRLRADVDLDEGVPDGQTEAEASLVARQARAERDVAAVVAHAAEAVDQGEPGAADLGDVRAVHHVAADVGKVDHRREVEVFARLVKVTDLGRDDALNAHRQR